MITEQEFFDKTVRHLLTQNERSSKVVKRGELCMYRSPAGLRCAVGVHIPDALYRRDMEELSAAVLLSEFPSLAEYIPNVWLAKDLQVMHDCSEPSRWAFELRIIARDRGMDASVVGAVLKELGRTE